MTALIEGSVLCMAALTEDSNVLCIIVYGSFD